MSPVESNGSARVTLTKDPASVQQATGAVAIATALSGLVLAPPTIEIVDATYPELLSGIVSNVQPSAQGYSFDLVWPDAIPADPANNVRVTLKATIELACGPGGDPTRTVESITHVQLCDAAADELVWVSSGEVCKVCAIIAEMAPSPIVPDTRDDGLPLARVVRLRVVPVARVGRSIVLFAENDGDAGVAYAWHASAGRIVELAPDVMLWEPPDDHGPHLVQVAVEATDAAAVATFAWPEVAR
jgi:hypothetical protein